MDDKELEEVREWSFIRCKHCNGKTVLGYIHATGEVIMVCEVCKHYCPIKETKYAPPITEEVM